MPATREQSFIRLVNSVPGAFLYKDILFSINGICFGRVIYKERSKHKQKRVPNFFGTLLAVRTGLVTGLPLCLQRTLTPGHGESIYKKRRNLAVSSCGAYGTRTRDPMRDRHVF